MPKINLRDLYPNFYTSDSIIDIPEEVLSVFVEHERRAGRRHILDKCTVTGRNTPSTKTTG